jgi:hypothetical protein
VNKLKTIFPALMLASAACTAQSLQPAVIASDGGFATVSTGSISWTLGETVTETFTSPGNYLTQGFHQPRLLMVGVVGQVLPVNAGVYPNPTAAFLNINLSRLAGGEYSIALFDVVGNKVQYTTAMGKGGQTTVLDLSGLADGIYLLTISGSNFNQSFKVTKTN